MKHITLVLLAILVNLLLAIIVIIIFTKTRAQKKTLRTSKFGICDCKPDFYNYILRNSNANTKILQQHNKKYGFIGLGQMGLGMALNLSKKIENLTVFDTNPSAISELQKRNSKIKRAKTISEMKYNDVIITMLPNTNIVESIYSELMVPDSECKISIDSSTIHPSSAKKLGLLASQNKMTFMDAPVSGGILGANEATLTFMVGCDQEDKFLETKTVFDLMGKKVWYCGKASTGQIAKISNNLLLGITMIGVSEAMNLGIKLGMDEKLLNEIINSSSGRCWSSEVYNPVPGILPNVPASRDYGGGFGVSLIKKDLGIAIEAAEEVDANLIMAHVAKSMYCFLASHPRFQKKDFGVVYQWLKNNGNT